MNEKQHWNKIAYKYNDEIFDVFNSDKDKKLAHYFKKHGNKNHSATDFGCGNGKAFPFLSPLFKSVIGIDISQELINQAKKRPYKNTTFQTLDLSKKNLRLPKVNFVFSCNVIMLPVLEKNYEMLRNIYNTLLPGGKAVIVIPSFDSAMFSAWRIVDFHRRQGTQPNEIPLADLAYLKSSRAEIAQGILQIDGVPTKHYSELELGVIFKEAKLSITKIDKINYGWDSEFASPPKWMKDPYPWDWLIECEKK